jgi:hypothetical protein
LYNLIIYSFSKEYNKINIISIYNNYLKIINFNWSSVTDFLTPQSISLKWVKFSTNGLGEKNQNF